MLQAHSVPVGETTGAAEAIGWYWHRTDAKNLSGSIELWEFDQVLGDAIDQNQVFTRPRRHVAGLRRIRSRWG